MEPRQTENPQKTKLSQLVIKKTDKPSSHGNSGKPALEDSVGGKGPNITEGSLGLLCGYSSGDSD